MSTPMYEWDCPNCGERISSAVLPPKWERSVEELARALYEDAIASYRRKKLPSWFEMMANPSLMMGTTGTDKDNTRWSTLESWRSQARRIIKRMSDTTPPQVPPKVGP